MILEISIATTERTLWNIKAMPYFRETSISFFWVCGCNKLNKFNEGNSVFADGWTLRRTSRLGSCKLRYTLERCDQASLEMYWEDKIERVWKCTSWLRSSNLQDSLGGHDNGRLEIHLKVQIKAKFEQYLEVVNLEAEDSPLAVDQTEGSQLGGVSNSQTPFICLSIYNHCNVTRWHYLSGHMKR